MTNGRSNRISSIQFKKIGCDGKQQDKYKEYHTGQKCHVCGREEEERKKNVWGYVYCKDHKQSASKKGNLN